MAKREVDRSSISLYRTVFKCIVLFYVCVCMASEWILRFTKETKGRLGVLLSESSLCEHCFSSLYIEFCELGDERSTVVWEEENKERF